MIEEENKQFCLLVLGLGVDFWNFFCVPFFFFSFVLLKEEGMHISMYIDKLLVVKKIIFKDAIHILCLFL